MCTTGGSDAEPVAIICQPCRFQLREWLDEPADTDGD